ncbi:MAG: WD40/YVTN/BNR-like repeat-containing protein, partial [Planctomycetota bacterium]
LTGRISELARSTKENGVERGNWIGFYVKARMDSTGSPEMNRFFGIFRTFGRGMRGTAAWPDLGGQRIGEYEIKTDHDWLRVDRRGSRFTAYTSADGDEWTKVREHILKWGTTVYAGVTFRSQPFKNRTWPYAGMDHVALKRGAAGPDAARAALNPEDVKLDKGRVIASVQSLFSPKVFYARSRGAGVLRSANGGDTWKPVNGSLTGPDAMMVRSVAVHPKNPSIVLRGGGCLQGGKLVSGLWKSADGGRSWKLVSREIDFDGGGPSTLFGEVISFNPLDPNMVSAGGESAGIFVSFDAGDTWTYACQKGGRISCLQHSIAKDGLLLAGTFPDSEFEAVGLGRPSVRLSGQEYGRVLMGNRSGTKPPRVGTRVQAKHFGVTNLAFDVPKWGFLHCATTRGLYYTYNLGGIFQRHVNGLPFDTPYTALGSSLRLTKPNSKGKTASKVYAAPLSTDDAGCVYATTRWGRVWYKTEGKPRSPGPLNAGISGITCDVSDLESVVLCNRSGILKSGDGGKSYKLVYRSRGAR